METKAKKEVFDFKKNMRAIRSYMTTFGMIGSTLLIVLLMAVFNFIGAYVNYNMDSFFSVLMMMVNAVGYMFTALMVASSYASTYGLVCMLPMQASSVPTQMVSIVDLTAFVVMGLDVITMAIFGYREEIFLKLCIHVASYLMATVVLYVLSRILFKTTLGVGTKTVFGIIGFVSYLMSVSACSAAFVLMVEDGFCRENLWGILVTLGAIGVAAAIATELVRKGLRNCIRQAKIYKSKKKTVKDEAYV